MRMLCIAIHDVAPPTWPSCETLCGLLRTLGSPPATLLVVPDYHRRGSLERDSGFIRAIERRIAGGDELALHGWHHLDDGPAPRSPVEWLRRRVLTASEGEFAALSEHEADRRIAAGLDLFARLGWDAAGFVAPAWLLGAGARRALARTELRYASTHTHLESLADARRVPAPAISASARSNWRRWASRRWLRVARGATRHVSLLRIALHPADAHDRALVEAWRALLTALLAERDALTKSAALHRSLAAAERVASARA
jgi:predicted deacetylase